MLSCKLLPLLLLLLSALLYCAAPAVASDERINPQAALTAFNALAGIYNSKIFDSMSASNVAHLLNNAFDVFQGLFGFFKDPNSDLLEKIRKEFCKVHRKLDKISNKVTRLEELVKYYGSISTYMNDQKYIRTTYGYLTDYLQERNKEKRKNKRKTFSRYCRKADRRADHLYRGIIDPSSGTLKNLAQVIIEFTHYHKNRVSQFLLDLTRIIMQGSEAAIACARIRDSESQAKTVANSWRNKIKELMEKVRAADRACYNQRPHQWRKDVSTKLIDFSSLNNKQFTEEMYEFFAEKYYWRYWFVMRHDSFARDGKNIMSGAFCSGSTHYGKHNNRFVVISHQAPKNTRFNRNKAIRFLNEVDNEVRYNRAFSYVDAITKRTGSDCRDSTVRYALRNGISVHTKASKDRQVYKLTKPLFTDQGNSCWTESCKSWVYIFG